MGSNGFLVDNISSCVLSYVYVSHIVLLLYHRAVQIPTNNLPYLPQMSCSGPATQVQYLDYSLSLSAPLMTVVRQSDIRSSPDKNSSRLDFETARGKNRVGALCIHIYNWLSSMSYHMTIQP